MEPTPQVGGWPAWAALALVAVSLALAIAHAVRPSKRTLVRAVVAMAVSVAGGLLGTGAGVLKSFAAVADIDPAIKATILAKGISEAMNCTAFALGGVLVWSIPFVAGELRRRRAQPPAGGPT